MKLKGQAVSKISQIKRVKMESTLKRMQDVRMQDTENLRDKLKIRVLKLKADLARGEADINRISKQLLKIEGAIILIEEILAPTLLEQKPEEKHE